MARWLVPLAPGGAAELIGFLAGGPAEAASTPSATPAVSLAPPPGTRTQRGRRLLRLDGRARASLVRALPATADRLAG